MSKPSSLETFVSDLVRSLPPAEKSAEELMRMARDKAPSSEVMEILRQDAGLCANLLALANSECYRSARSRPIETVEDALALLGIEPITMLVGASYCMQSLRPTSISEKIWSEYESHGREISQVCTLLAQRLGLPQSECRMYTAAGLTHDIGRAVIMIAQDSPSASLVGTSPDEMARLVRDEKAAYGMNHCEIGARIFENWHFSKTMHEGILRHHTPLIRDDFSFPGGLIFVSHFVTLSDFTGEIIARMLPPRLLGLLKVTREDFDAVRRILTGPAPANPRP